MLEELGDGYALAGEGVAILVGPNGSGKSHLLRALALQSRHRRDTIVVCNTAHDRFVGMRGIRRLSAGRSGQSPKTVIKQAVARTLEAPDSRYFQSGAILEYCGYRPRFGFEVELPRWRHDPGHDHELADDPDLAFALGQLDRLRGEVVWIDQRDQTVEGYLARDFVAVLKLEDRLRRHGYLRDIAVFLDHKDRGPIKLHRASSGELSLISSLVFLVSLSSEAPLVLIDEPENSLHPRWQREYLDKVLAAMTYRGATIVVATHAPLVVTGALTDHAHIISVHQVRDGRPVRLNLRESGEASESIEAVLYRAFDVITPASHFVSNEVQDVVTRLERGEITPEDAIARVDDLDRSSFDERQHAFFIAVRQVIDRFSTPQAQAPNDDE